MSSSNGVVERDLSMTLATLSATLNTCDNIAYEREISAKIALCQCSLYIMTNITLTFYTVSDFYFMLLLLPGSN